MDAHSNQFYDFPLELCSRFFYKSGEHSKALRHLLKYASTSQDDSEALNLAIEVVGTAPPNQPHLTR